MGDTSKWHFCIVTMVINLILTLSSLDFKGTLVRDFFCKRFAAVVFVCSFRFCWTETEIGKFCQLGLLINLMESVECG